MTVATLAMAMTMAARAAEVAPSDLSALRAQARRSGVVPVLVHLQASSLQQVRSAPSALSAISDWKARRLLAELGSAALENGRSDTSAGHLVLYVTEQGLDVLRGTANAIAFFPTVGWMGRTALNGLDGSHDAIEEMLRLQGYVDLEVVANVESLETIHLPNGRQEFRAAAQALRDASAKLSALLQSAREGEIDNRAAVLAAMAPGAQLGPAASPLTTMRVTREGLLRLSQSAAIRSIRPVGFVDRRAVVVDPEAMEEAAKYGEASVIVTMRDVHSGGKLSQASVGALAKSNRAAINALLEHARPGAVKQDFARFGAVSAQLTKAELAKLVEANEPRLLAVSLNKPVATAQLATSGPTMNMAAAQNANPPIVAGGQNVIIIDTGVQANHPFLGSRVVFQACFGTTGPSGGFNYVSLCPGATAGSNWDSPPGTPNAAAPALGSAHGTHVSGIAGGDQGVGVPAGLRGTAPSASIYAVQVFSQRQGTSTSSAFPADWLAALELAAQSLPPLENGNARPFTINLSLGGGRATGPCNTADFTPYMTAVQQLRAAGVPVVVATGNAAFTDAIAFPACLPGVIKVSSAANDGVGNTRSVFNAQEAANVVNPANFPGETFWLAPGGGNGTAVRSSVTGPLVFDGFSGTSMAAPQITGLYASAKGAAPAWTVQQVTDWFFTNARVPVQIGVGAGQPPLPAATWFRIRLPAL